MGRLLFLVFLIVPLIEIGLFIVIGQSIGLLLTLGGVVVTAVIGSAIIRTQGLSLIAEIRQLMGAGALPARQLADGVMLAIAGALLLTPGYFTDLAGFLLLVPPIRLAIYTYLKSRISLVGSVSSSGAGFSGFGASSGPGPIPRNDIGGGGRPDSVDLDDEDWRPRP